MSNWDNNEEIQLFREYLRIRTDHPDPNYDECIKFFTRQAELLDLPLQVYYPAGKPMIVLRWNGIQPDLPAILLYSHMDVVPAFREQWTHDPFGAEMDSDGKIYGRGTQDMKSVGMQHLAAVKSMKKEGIRVKRNILIMYGADEEMGSIYGMMPFVKTKEFRDLNIGFAMDEGDAVEENIIPIIYNEKKSLPVEIKCSGSGGHGMLLLENTPGEKLRFILNKFMDFRAAEVKKLEDNPDLTIGRVTSVNLTIVKGGVQSNVIPPDFTILLDVRIGVDTKQSELEKIFTSWCKEAGEGVELIFYDTGPQNDPINLEDNILYRTVKTAVEEMGIHTKPDIDSGGTDSRFLRSKGVIAVGFSPMNKTVNLMHGNNEYLEAEIFLKGIEIFKNVILKVGNM